ncbi:MAG: hypothetical protein ACL93V_11945 [Candidatus Electrothrix sp. YB6]
MKKNLLLLATVFSIIYIPLLFLFFFIVPDSSIEQHRENISNVLDKPASVDHKEQEDRSRSEKYDRFNEQLSNAVAIVARENENTENIILLLNIVAVLIPIIFSIITLFFCSQKEKSKLNLM